MVDDAWSRSVVDVHNELRGKVNPPAADMKALRWNASLAGFALAYARACAWEHNPGRGDRGENLYLHSKELDVAAAVRSWFAERDSYNFVTNACAQGKMCGHYTQVVWASVDEVGCGSHLCPTVKNVNLEGAYVFVCNYMPGGNYQGERPYQEGAPCTKCNGDCRGNLCYPPGAHAGPGGDAGPRARGPLWALSLGVLAALSLPLA